MERSCSTCVHEKGKKCKILKEKISCGCFAWADEEEAIKREKAIEKYSFGYGYSSGTGRKNMKLAIEKRLEKIAI